MKTGTAKIFKQDDVQMSGSLELNYPLTSNVQGPPQVSRIQKKAQVQVVEKTDQYAVIRVTCSCGKITNIKCQYN